ncbi:hypothetical protein OIU84_002866 [Salix udensis]|uniref:Uncharacterized protein n=1 Tax=Salix udensis TaxID=889485 RepID=A0AAD6P5S0_9ROSI|nr:hypothetical protein OIU84_002866 [Salix udensis]
MNKKQSLRSNSIISNLTEILLGHLGPYAPCIIASQTGFGRKHLARQEETGDLPLHSPHASSSLSLRSRVGNQIGLTSDRAVGTDKRAMVVMRRKCINREEFGFKYYLLSSNTLGMDLNCINHVEFGLKYYLLSLNTWGSAKFYYKYMG